MPKIGKILRSARFWITILVLPLVLIGCAGLFIDSDPDFISDEFIARETIRSDVGKGIELSYLRSGDPNGQRIIFVHGTPGDAAGNWLDLLRNVPDGYEFIAVDRPGFGFTKPRKQMVALDDQVDALAPLFVTRNGKPTILAGHSLGGPIVAAAAANYPDEIGGIAILAGALDPDLEDVLFIQYVGNIPPISWLLPSFARNANRELIALEDELRLLQPKLASIQQPVVIVHGTEDDLVPYANVPFMQRTMTGTKNLEVVKIDGMNHFLQWRQQDIIMDAIMKIAERSVIPEAGSLEQSTASSP